MDFETVYTELFTPLYRYVFFRVKNYDEAMDIIQNVFMKIFEKYPDKQTKDLYPLIYRSIKNEIIDRGLRKKATSMDPTDDFFTNRPDESLPHPEQQYHAREYIKHVSDLLEFLDEQEKEIIILRFLQEREYAEIAEIIGKTESTLRQIISRALKKLRNHYENEPFHK